jgi:hypothetical protein
MGEIGTSSRVLAGGRGDFNGKIEEQTQARDPAKPKGIAPEQRGKPARRVQERGRHGSRTNNRIVQAGWPCETVNNLGEEAFDTQAPGGRIFLPGIRKLLPTL